MTTQSRFSAVEVVIGIVVLAPILYAFVAYPSLFAFGWKDVVLIALYVLMIFLIHSFTKSRKRSTSL